MEVRQLQIEELVQYAQIPISFEVNTILRPSPVRGGLGVVETQNVNVPACRFYARNRFSLSVINLYGYSHPAVAHEVKLEWTMDLA